DLAGFGAQFNQNVYAAISRNVGVTEANVKDMEAKVVALHPNFVRLFLLPNAYTDPHLMLSFVRSAPLARRAGAPTTVTWSGQTQDQWLAFLASNMSDLLDAWSVHIYWDYWDTAKMVRRLTEVRQIWDALPPTQRKPLYVTEYSPRGIRNPGGPVDPGAWQDGTPLAQTNINAFQNAWFDLLASKLGY